LKIIFNMNMTVTLRLATGAIARLAATMNEAKCKLMLDDVLTASETGAEGLS